MKCPRVAVFAVVVFASVLFVVSRPVLAKDEWLQVRSKNFYLIGNASEKDIRKVGTRLEEFRETFRLLFLNANLNSPIPTNVIVFKSDSAFKPFKPLRGDGKADNFIAGYFQPGDDMNWIAVSAEGDDKEMYGTIFHEYVHFIINTSFGKTEVPPWFNEGLAEYYQTFGIENGEKVKLGLPQGNHLMLLQQTKFIPLEQLFRVSNAGLHQQGDHSRSIFYAESWALIHYMLQGGKTENLSKFLNLVLADTPQEKAFQDAFQMTYAQMETELRKYVSKATYNYVQITLKNKLNFDAEMQTSPLEDAESNARLGDLLYHTNRADDAEPFLQNALKQKPDLSMANTTLGMVKIRQRKWDEAKTFLEKAIAEDQKNHMAYYWYAFLLSRENRDEFGYVRSYPKESADKMRGALRKAIAINPTFTESYELLAYVDLVTNEELDDAVALLRRALQYQPGNQRYAIRMAEIYMRQNNFTAGSAIAEKISRTADDSEIKSRADQLISEITQRKEYFDRRSTSAMTTAQQSGGPPALRTREEKQLSPEELKKIREDATLRSINGALREPEASETRIVGNIQKIECKGSSIKYIIRTDSETFSLASKDFQGLLLNTFISDLENVSVGCGQDLSANRVVVTYKARTNAQADLRGDLVGLEFVPNYFRLMTSSELNTPTVVVNSERTETASSKATAPVTGGNVDVDAMRRSAMLDNIRTNIRKPGAGEKQDIGFLDRIECTEKGIFFYMRTTAQTLKLLNVSPKDLPIHIFTPDLEGVRFGCNAKISDVPAVFTYMDKPDGKAKSAGQIVSLDFVPKTFSLN